MHGNGDIRERFVFFIKAFWIAGKNFIWDDCLIISSSISFVFLLAIIPFSALFLFLMNLFKNLFLPGLFPENMVDIFVQDLSEFIPFISKKWIYSHLINSTGFGSFTTINLIMLPIISGLLFKSLEVSFRRIFHLKPRNLIKGHMLYAALSIFAILIFFTWNFIWTILSDAIRSFQFDLDQNSYFNDFYSIIIDYFTSSHIKINLLSWLMLILFFLITVKLFLRIPIKQHHRIVGGVLFGLLWLFARKFFGLYIRHITHFNVLYGSLSSVCIILLWIFYSAIALFYSVEFMYVLHCGRDRIWLNNPRTKFRK
jgi:YihY family inner membrane protein